MAFLSMFAGPLIVLALIGGLYGTHKLAVWNAGRVATNVAEARCDADKEVLRKRATDLALLASARLTEIEAATQAAQGKRNEKFGSLAERAKAVQRGGGIPIPFDVDSVLRDSASGANAARPPFVSPKGTAPISGPAEPTIFYDEADFAKFQVASARAYADAYGQWRGCIAAYESVRTTVNPVETKSPGLFDWLKPKEK